ncbi:TerB family tellurite resistance protein [Cobetia sp. 10Alg 146]|uniref:tellurite resistance TerB family protein n=1 Tax=Cobetia sp. 10Alg 146 TaxID=3040019 RepID=UPI00244BB31A|nr:TerB family tellurite resistance protein [Cobetia sp. 10Alg 146]MDH2292475.1 TerB family tellurite resistance protein [Cobetia sp. 10Alg 146]
MAAQLSVAGQINRLIRQVMMPGSNARPNDEPGPELAMAVLMFEVVRADDHLDVREREALARQLAERFSLEKDELASLLSQAEQDAEQATDHYRFVKQLNEHMSLEERTELIGMLWELAYADGELDAHEEHRIRRLAGLLHVSHSEFIRTKLTAQPNK